MKQTVAIVEDDHRLRKQLLRILSSLQDINCVADYSSAEEGLADILRHKPDVVLMDIKLPKMSGIQCVIELKKILPSVQIIMVTVYEDGDSIFNALKAGASGYLIKSDPPEQLIEAIRGISSGATPMSTPVARKVVGYFHMLGPSGEESKKLSPREEQVLSLVASGCTYKEISTQLKIGVETVRSYIKTACEKMHVHSRTEAVAQFSRKQSIQPRVNKPPGSAD